jgi:D-alanine-D-alanine ligase
MSKKINLAVIFGGKSGEHEVSLSSVQGVIKALNKEKYNIFPIAITKKGNWLLGEKGQEYLSLNSASAGKEGGVSLEDSQKLVSVKDQDKTLVNFFKGSINERIDLVLPILHGPYGEDGRLQGFLDTVGIPYVFSGHLAHAIGMNKSKAKIIVRNFGVPVAKDILLNKLDAFDLDQIISDLGLPVMVKPGELGSSVGVTKAKTKEELEQAIQNAFSYCNEVVVEQFIAGREFTVTIMDRPQAEVLAITEIIPLVSEFYDFKAKYADGGSKHVCPAELPKEVEELMKKYALLAFKSIGCKDLARVDFMWDEKNNQINFIEINTIPGMTPTSLAPEAAKFRGMDFGQFLDELIKNNL